MQKTVLRHRAVCTSCSSKLPPRAEAWYDDETRTAMCLTCHRLAEHQGLPEEPSRVPPAPPVAPRPRADAPAPPTGPLPATPAAAGSGDAPGEAPAPVDPPAWPDPGFAPPKPPSESRPRIRAQVELPTGLDSWPTAGAPAVDEAVPSTFAPGSRTRRLPLVGPSLAAELKAPRTAPRERRVEEPPPPPVPWALQPTPDEELSNIGRALRTAQPQGIEILRSRPWGGTSVGTENFVVAPSGVWVVDGIDATDGAIPKGFLSGHAGSELINVVGGRTSIISGLLFDSAYNATPVRGALCFEQDAPGWFDETFFLAGILVTDIRSLVDAFFSPLVLDAETRKAIAHHLAVRL